MPDPGQAVCAHVGPRLAVFMRFKNRARFYSRARDEARRTPASHGNSTRTIAQASWSQPGPGPVRF